jgi:hypothetical protein
MAKFVFRESFDTYTGRDAPVGFFSRWTCTDRGDYSLQPGRFLGRSLFLGNQQSNECFRPLDEEITEFTVGFSGLWYGLPTGFMGGSYIKTLNANLQRQWGIMIDPDGSIFFNGGANGARVIQANCRSAPYLIQPNVWNFFELEIKLHKTEGFVRLYMNGDPEPVISAVNIDTVFDGPGPARYLDLGVHPQFAGGVNWRIDDIYIWDEPIRRGPIRIESLPVDGNGAHQDFTPLTGADNAAMIDDVTPNIADYVIGTAPGQYDQYTIKNLSSDSATIFEVNLIMLGQQTGSTIRAIALGLESGEVVDMGPDIYMGSGFARYERRLSKNPDGNVDWTREAVNDLILRPEITV